MKLFNKNFFRDEDGAVTVDWVVLTAAIVGLGIAVLTSVSTGTTNAGRHHLGRAGHHDHHGSLGLVRPA